MSSLERLVASMSAIVASTEFEGPRGMPVPKSTCCGPGGEVRHHASTVVRDHNLARVTLHVPGIDEA